MAIVSLDRHRPAENLLVGAALRAACRFSQGASIENDEFDSIILNLLRAVVGVAEIIECGQVYAQAIRDDQNIGIPRAIVALNQAPAPAPYTRKQYIRDALALTPEILSYPGNKVATLGAGRNDMDTGEAGVMVYTAPQEENIPLTLEDGATVLELKNTERLQVGTVTQLTRLSSPRQVHLTLRCDRGEDATHWAIAAGTDHSPLLGYGRLSATKLEQHAVQIEQRAERGLEIQLQAWNGHGSNGPEDEWVTPLMEALSSISWECLRDVVDNPELTVTLLAQTRSFFSFITRLRNQDTNDSLGRYKVFLDSSALDWLWGQPNYQLCLGRMWNSRLYLNWEPSATENDEATIKCYSRNLEGIWSSGPDGPIPSYQGMPMIRFRGEMFGLLANPHDNQLCSTRWNGNASSWDPPRPMAGHQTTTQISAAVVNEVFYVAFRDLIGDIIVISTTDLDSWTPATQLGQAKTDYSPALGFNGRGLLAAYCGTEGQIYSTSNNPDGSWKAWMPVPAGRSLAAPTMMWFDGAMNLIYVGEDSRLRFQRRPPGSTEWSAPFVFAEACTRAACKVASFGTYLMMGIRGLDGRGTVKIIQYTSGGGYSMQQLDGCHSSGPLGMCNWDGKLWVTYSEKKL